MTKSKASSSGDQQLEGRKQQITEFFENLDDSQIADGTVLNDVTSTVSTSL